MTSISSFISNIRVSFFLAGNYTDDIIACALSDSPQLAFAGIEVLNLIINAGLGAPHHWFPTLVALETSPVPLVCQIASRARVKAVERYEHVIDGVYLDGMRKMFTYQKTVLDSIKGMFPMWY
jgi:cohesin loading factor subunit SCC2